ncbi:hypothetical protein C0995_006329 [Termitomyces sp. Mi166|nr:hypothetical protein C0995_006329 [Termitomyces sp. Mi166\
MKRLYNSKFTLVLSFKTLLVLAAVLVAALAGTFMYPYKTSTSLRESQHTVGKLPFMGYNTWNAYYCDIDEKKVLETARLMKSLGLINVGYDHMNLDDCYSEKERSPSGDIVANKERFPSGMSYLTDQLHKLGLKAGIYSDSGWVTCQRYPGSFQNEERDIKLFQDWGFDLLKYDNCGVPYDSIIKEGLVGKYSRMAEAIDDLSKSSGKPPILFSICEWGRAQPWMWARNLGQTWRTTEDIGPEWWVLSKIINRNSFIAWASDFYGHNDMDILEVGNGQLTYDEAKSHFTAWALMKSPLLISTNLATISKETLGILKNREIIAINQDPVVGTSIIPFRWGINLNVLDHPADMFFNLTESPWIRAGRQYHVRVCPLYILSVGTDLTLYTLAQDLWTHTDNGTAVRNFTAYEVPPHGVVALLLRDAGDEPAGLWPPCARFEWCMDQNGTRLDNIGFGEGNEDTRRRRGLPALDAT